MCVTDRHDMTLAVKVALKPNTTNQPTIWKVNNMKQAPSASEEIKVNNSLFLQYLAQWSIVSLPFEDSTDAEKNAILPFNPLPRNLTCEEALKKTLWEKEKIVVTSIFSFSDNVF